MLPCAIPTHSLLALLRRLVKRIAHIPRSFFHVIRRTLLFFARLARGRSKKNNVHGGQSGDSNASTITLHMPHGKATTSVVCGSSVPQIGPVIQPTPQSTMLSPAVTPPQQNPLGGLPEAMKLHGFSRASLADTASMRSVQWTSRSGTSLRHVSRSPSPMSSRASSPCPSSSHDVRPRTPSESRLNVPSHLHPLSVSIASGRSNISSTLNHSSASPAGCGAVPVGMMEPSILKPIHPGRVRRYERNNKIGKTSAILYKIPPRDNFTPRSGLVNVPQEWQPEIHPEGALYFRHVIKNILTEADLTDPRTLNFVETCIAEIEADIRENGLNRASRGDTELLEDTELVLEPLEEEDEEGIRRTRCGYYFADLTNRTLFWFDEYDTGLMLDEVQALSEDHMKYELESQYWRHCELFPNHRAFQEDLINELRCILLHAGIDAFTSSGSTSPYSWQDTERMLSLMKHAPILSSTSTSTSPTPSDACQGYVACSVSRLMGVFVHSRFLHFYGTRMARLAREQTVYEGSTRKPSRLFWVLSYFLFYAPRKHLESLDKMWVDKIINYVSWTRFMEHLLDEWSDLSLTTTVMLTVDVSFLAIQSVDVASQHAGFRGAAQIPIYVSTVASAGSIIIGLLLTRHHRIIPRDDAEIAQQYLWGKYKETWGFEFLAIFYSVPYALLMWAMVTFLIGLTFVCFSVDSIFPDTNLRVHLPSALAWAFVLGLIFLYLHMDWEGRNDTPLKRFFRGLRLVTSPIRSPLDCVSKLETLWGFMKSTRRRASQENEGSSHVEAPEEQA
ncbi:hypothetical protein NEOLEDRAFT_1114043 [Neolentinus lepideus HHB14362 ss-1]|uniref:WW domain-containing protein n=1 Tax=Neolentinus lepideus HHB14362 ss-1 TaxID=1314782 RepID=A0A165SUN7_9AGAM|nr:hypothetical protein NEOLEDRAFT_1114043 [Neolentinus lepideus HHB14362 ss-1]